MTMRRRRGILLISLAALSPESSAALYVLCVTHKLRLPDAWMAAICLKYPPH